MAADDARSIQPILMSKQTPALSDLSGALRTLAQAGVAVFAQDAELRYRWIENPPSAWRGSDVAGKSETDVLPAKAAAYAAALKRQVLQSGRAQWAELIVDAGAGSAYFDMFLEPDRDSTGKVVGLVGLAIDTTDRRKQEVTIEAIARDLSHRTKNLLAVIQSLGTQTARASASTDEFIEQFRGRIQSISRSQDLSIGVKRHGASLSELVETQVYPYVDDVSRRIEYDGADRFLTPNGALHIGLALYELCVSSAQSGALSAPEGKIQIAAKLHDGAAADPSPYLEMTWQESGGPPAAKLEGFSKIFLERIVPASVGGTAAISDSATGRRYTLSIAGAEFE
jgi:two-component sensor histidine kinase